MDYATKLALRAIISGLRYSQRINDTDCEHIVQALDEVGTKAWNDGQRNAAGVLDAFTADVARDCFGATHPIALAAKQKSETDPSQL